MQTYYHGDCLKAHPLVPSSSVALIATDLPYGVLTSAATSWDVPLPMDALWEQWRRILTPNGVVVLTGVQPFSSLLVTSNLPWFRFADVWDKRMPVGHLNAKKRPLRVHEDLLIFSPVKLGRFTYNPQMVKGELHKRSTGKRGDGGAYPRCYSTHYESDERYPTSIISVSGANQRAKSHPTEKPVALFEYIIRTYSNEGETVLDCCAGSFACGVACVRTRRNFIGIEQGKGYFDAGCERIEQTERDMAFRLLHPAEALK